MHKRRAPRGALLFLLLSDALRRSVDGLHAEADTPLLVDLQHLDLDHIAFLELVADALDTLFGDLRDVHQAVAARQDGHEGAEVHQFDDLALVDATHFHIGGDVLDALAGGFALGLVHGGDLDGAVVLDLDGRAGLLLDAAHHYAALADDVADLLGVDLDDHDARRPLGHVGTGLGDDLVHLAEDVQTAVLRLGQGLLHDLLGDALDLDVHLQRGHAGGGARDLEVHVAQVVLVAE